MSDKISVIIPVYNIEEYLRRCVDSVIAQTYENIEIILVDDGSTDSSGEICDEYAEQFDRIKALHGENAGSTTARLKGVEAATGEWIGFVDSDDKIDPDMYERLLHNAKEYDAEISHCGYRYLHPDGRISYFWNTRRLAQQDRLSGLKDLITGSTEPGVWNKLFHKTLFHSLLHTDVIDRSIVQYEDKLINFYLFSQAKKSVFEDVCPYVYIVREDSVSRGQIDRKMIFDPITVNKYIKDSVDPKLSQLACGCYFASIVGAYKSLAVNNRKKYSDYLSELRQMINDNYEYKQYAGKRTRFTCFLIKHFPWLLAPMQRVWSFFVKGPYA